MKKTLLLLLLFIAGIVSAQKYVPFPTGDAEWNINYTTGTYGFPTSSYLKQYSLHGDTVINNVTYRKLCMNIGTVDNPVYKVMGGLREQDKKIYYWGGNFWENFNSSSSEEVTLYDFNKVVGEVVTINNYTSYTITKIDSVKIGNSYRKRYNDRIIEGIGDVQEGLLGIITPRFTCMECIYNWQFICFSQNGESIYKNRDYVDCESTKKWSEVKYLNDNTCWTNYDFIKYQYYLKGDTTINGNVYKKLYFRRQIFGEVKDVYLTSLKEASGKIYASDYNWNGLNYTVGEYLLYDFSAEVGDTIKSNITPDCNCNLLEPQIVTSISTVTLQNGETRKKYLLSHSSTWVEGIGSLNGLFYDAFPIILSKDRPQLICYKQYDSFLFSQGSMVG